MPLKLSTCLLALPCALAAVLAVGCLEEHVTVYKDYPVFLDDRGGTEFLDGDPSLEIGVYREQLFRTYHDGDDAEIVNGTQGGWWLHLALRAVALGKVGRVQAEIRSDDADGVLLGRVGQRVRLALTREGFFEAQTVPVPFDRDLSNDQMLALVGHLGWVSVSYTSGERSASASTEVVFAYR